ncbi:MAG: hypothetical protein P1V18_00320 [Candidatus Gracilibacteria bacterium]|nr:hypothetical protein [Candidatus Gracilibacteria bacterium]
MFLNKNSYQPTKDSKLEREVSKIKTSFSQRLDFQSAFDPVIEATRESISQLPELAEAVRALSEAGASFIRCETQFNSGYYARDFRIRKDADKHMETLKKYWSDPAHPSYNIWKILDLTKKEQEQKESNVKNMWKHGFKSNETSLSTETVWRRIKGIDVVLRGFVASRKHSEKKQAFEDEITKHAGAFSFESTVNMRSATAVKILFNKPELGLPLQALIKRTLELNPEAYIIDIEPRNDGYVRYMEPFNENTLPEDFYIQYHQFLLDLDPALQHIFTKVDELKLILANLNEEVYLELPHQAYTVQRGIDFQKFLYAKKLDGAGWGFTNLLAEPHIGFGEYLGAAKAWQIISSIEKINQYGVRLKGPLVLNRDPYHIQAVSHFLDNPDEMIRCLLFHPHLGTLPNVTPPERDMTREENRERILYELKNGIWDENPFAQSSKMMTYKSLQDYSIVKKTPQGGIRFVYYNNDDKEGLDF